MLCLSGLAGVQAQVTTTAVYVGNVGNFSDANGSVTVYDPATGDVTRDVLPDLNTLVQSITLHEGSGYVMANTANRIDVFSLGSNTRTAQISGVESPRYMTVVTPGKAYASNLYAGTVTVINLADNTAGAALPVGSNPEAIAVVGGRAYVANAGFGADSTLTVIDVATDQVVETLDVGCDGPRFLAVDAQEELWVFCTGNTVYNEDFTEIIAQTNGEAVVLDGASGAVIERFPLDVQIGSGAAGQDVFYAAAAEEAFVVAGSTLLTFDTATNAPGASITVPGTETIGAVAYDAATERLYLGRIPGFTEAGFVSIHARTGAEVDRFDAGVAPASIALLQTGSTVAREAPAGLPTALRLYQNYPNPFNPTTTIQFATDHAAPVSLKVYTLLGEEVATLVDEVLPAGTYTRAWDAGRLASGTYVYRLQAGSRVQAKTLILLK